MSQTAASPVRPLSEFSQDRVQTSHSAPSPSTLLDSILSASTADDGSLARFLRETTPGNALREWLGPLPNLKGPALKHFVAQRLSRDIARLDQLLSDQVNAILHHPEFQQLEASWRSLRYLVDQTPDGGNIKIKLLNVSWRELTKDLMRAVEFDQSQLFRKVYNDEFGTPGGEPFGVLVGDYEIRHRMSADYPYNDIETLTAIAGVAAAAFAPFIAAAHPSLLDLTSFADLERPLNLPQTFENLEYLKWKAFRKIEDARYVGLTMPRVLARLPYTDDSARADLFRFREDVSGTGRSHYLWGNAAYAFAGVLMRSFDDNGWLADIRGARREELSGGIVADLPSHCFSTDRLGIAPKCTTDAIITDAQEKELGMLGFIPLCHCQDTQMAAFYGNQSVQEPREWTTDTATANSRMSAMLQYMLCAARFAHYIKVIFRDRIGLMTGPAETQQYLRAWLMNYATSSDKPDSRHPLREAKVDVVELPEKPGAYTCRIYLRPHYQLDQLATVLKLESTLAPGRA